MTTKGLFAIGMGLLLVLALGSAAPPREENKAVGFFHHLAKGQSVGLKDLGNAYQINIFPGEELGHKVVEVAPDYIVLEDMIGVTRTRIPIYALKSITITQIEKPRR